MPRPRIGLTLDLASPDQLHPASRDSCQLNAAYVDAVLHAGGLPILLPHTPGPPDLETLAHMLNSVDALLLPGGPDVDPALYGQPLHPSTQIMHPRRQNFDFAILNLAEARALPILGICLGCQEMNVQRRGTLHQNLTENLPQPPSAENPFQHHYDRVRLANIYSAAQHPVTVRPRTLLHQILGTENLPVNSRHRQGIATLGHGLVASALAPDGLIEAIEDPTLPFWLAVQWHPEDMPATPSETLFSALVEAAAQLFPTRPRA